MHNTAIQLLDITEDLAMTVRSSSNEILENIPELEAQSQLHFLQNSTSQLHMAPLPETARRSSAPDLGGDRQPLEHLRATQSPDHYRLLNASRFAETPGVSERWVRDNTTRQCPRIRAVFAILGPGCDDEESTLGNSKA
jgi:hypothetical protein